MRGGCPLSLHWGFVCSPQPHCAHSGAHPRGKVQKLFPEHSFFGGKKSHNFAVQRPGSKYHINQARGRVPALLEGPNPWGWPRHRAKQGLHPAAAEAPRRRPPLRIRHPRTRTEQQPWRLLGPPGGSEERGSSTPCGAPCPRGQTSGRRPHSAPAFLTQEEQGITHPCRDRQTEARRPEREGRSRGALRGRGCLPSHP